MLNSYSIIFNATYIESLEEENNSHIAKNLNINRKTVIKWKQRWQESKAQLDRIKKDEPHKLNNAIKEILEIFLKI